MAAPADYWDEKDLKALTAGGFVNEDVMQKIWDISAIPLPFTDSVGVDTAKQSYTEWVQDSLATPDITNAVVSGADASGNDAAGGSRVGNHCQNSVKVVAVTERAIGTDVIGGDNFAFQLMMRQQELRRDVEAIAVTRQASVADDNNTVAGKAGGFAAWLETNAQTSGTVGGFNTSTKVVDAPTVGARRALSFDYVRTAVEEVYLQNGEASILMTRPEVVKRLNTFIFANASNYMATPTANVSGTAPTDQAANGFINVMRTDFGFTLRIVPNRLQQLYPDSLAADACDVFLIDPARVALAYLKNYQTKPLAKLGLSERSQISVDWTVKVYVEKAHAIISEINPTAAVVA